MMVKNEEKNLDRCLSSLQPIRSEIPSELIIVDTGSTDNTVIIARKYTDKVYFHEWNNNFAEMRNKTISYAKGEWLLILDADEVIDQPQGLINFLKSSDSGKYNSGLLNIINITDEKDESTNITANVFRLFKNNGFKYIGVIHEQPLYKIPVIFIDTNIIHYGYLSTDKELMENKFKRNLELLKSELEKDPENIYYWYQLSQTYGMHKDYKLALKAAEKGYEIARRKKIDLSSRMYIFSKLISCYKNISNYIALENICLEGLKYNNKMIDLYYFAALAQAEQQKHQDAINNFKKYLDLLEKKNYYKDPSVFHYSLGWHESAYVKLCEMNILAGNLDEALFYINKVKSKRYIKFVISNMVKIFIKQSNFNDLYEFYKKRVKNEKENMDVFFATLENELDYLYEEENMEILEKFGAEDNDYALLYNVRLEIYKNNYANQNLIDKIKNVDLTNCPSYFGDLVYYAIKSGLPLINILSSARNKCIERFTSYIMEKYDDAANILLNYLKQNRDMSKPANLRINRIIGRYLVISSKLDDNDFKAACNLYINDGMSHIVKVYNPGIIDIEDVSEAASDEDAFLIYILAAERVKEQDAVSYVRYLRKALKVYPEMEKCVDFLKEEFEHYINKKSAENLHHNSEFSALKQALKVNIETLLSAGRYLEAEAFINEYLKIVPADSEMQKILDKIKTLIS